MTDKKIKGYVRYFDQYVPITWERETKMFVYNAKKIVEEDGIMKTDRRLYDSKVSKKEIFEPNKKTPIIRTG